MAAALLAPRHEVRIYDLPEFNVNLNALMSSGGIHLITNGVARFVQVSKVTADVSEAMIGADVIFISVPACGQTRFFQVMAPHLEGGQIVLLSPGYFGALVLHEVLRNAGVHNVRVVETEQSLYGGAKTDATTVNLSSIKKELYLGAIPSTRTLDLVDTLGELIEGLKPAPNVLWTSLNNINMVVHPAVTILNAGRYQQDGANFLFYKEGVTIPVAAVLEQIDLERIAVGNSLQLRLFTTAEWIRKYYDVSGDSLFELIRSCVAYQSVKAPNSFEHRFMTEDIPYGLMPLASLGRSLGVPTPHISAVIAIANTISRKVKPAPRTLTEMGLSKFDAENIIARVTNG
jgi:opine dehydrogenase